MAAVLTAASTLTASAVGFVSGLVWHAMGWRAASPTVAVALVGVAVIADRVLAPASIRRQVPQAWGRLFPPTGAALLYGARLGPGPFTVLNTWLWWSAALIGSTLGPWGAAVVSGAFGAGRVAVMLAVGSGAARWRQWEGPAAVALAASVVAAAIAAAMVVPVEPGSRGPIAAAADEALAERYVASPARRPPTSVPNVPADVASDLAARLPADLGPELTRVPDDPGDGLGPLDLEAAAAAEADVPAERALLETRSFEAGHARAWTAPDGRTAYAAVYRFASAAAAEAYQRDGAITLEGRGVRQYPVEAPAGALGFSDATDGPSGGRVTHGVAFVRGRHFVLVLVASSSTDGDGQHAARALAIEASLLNPA